jgi:tetratricopeptide (TPR) repeat protein
MPSAFPARSLARLALPIVVACLALQPADTARAQSQPNAAARAQRLDEQFARLKTVTDEQDGEELMAQAAMLIDLGMHPLALPLLNDIVKRAPDWAEGWNKRATALYLAGEHDLSLADIDRVLVLEPRHFGALAGMGLIRIARGEYRDALAAYRKALAVNPFLKERLELIPALEKKVGDKPI